MIATHFARSLRRFTGSTSLRPLASLQVHSSPISKFAIHSSALLKTVQPTPDLYLKDDGTDTGSVTSGMTEDEGSGDQPPASAHKYVVAGEAPSESHYGVPAGAYHSGDPLEPLQETQPPPRGQPSSTSPDYAHPVTTAKASRVDDGVGSSSAVRFRSSPGEMKEGGYGGAKLSQGVKATENKLDERNPQPHSGFGRSGIDHAWKERK